jgi:hypothetical protein
MMKVPATYDTLIKAIARIAEIRDDSYLLDAFWKLDEAQKVTRLDLFHFIGRLSTLDGDHGFVWHPRTEDEIYITKVFTACDEAAAFGLNDQPLVYVAGLKNPAEIDYSVFADDGRDVRKMKFRRQRPTLR